MLQRAIAGLRSVIFTEWRPTVSLGKVAVTLRTVKITERKVTVALRKAIFTERHAAVAFRRENAALRLEIDGTQAPWWRGRAGAPVLRRAVAARGFGSLASQQPGLAGRRRGPV